MSVAKNVADTQTTLLETKQQTPLKINGWKMNFLLGYGLFSQAVSFREGNQYSIFHHLRNIPWPQLFWGVDATQKKDPRIPMSRFGVLALWTSPKKSGGMYRRTRRWSAFISGGDPEFWWFGSRVWVIWIPSFGDLDPEFWLFCTSGCPFCLHFILMASWITLIRFLEILLAFDSNSNFSILSFSCTQLKMVFVLFSRWWFHIFLEFSPLLGEMMQFDEHIFQMGWFNHQPYKVFGIFTWICLFCLAWLLLIGWLLYLYLSIHWSLSPLNPQKYLSRNMQPNEFFHLGICPNFSRGSTATPSCGWHGKGGTSKIP